jgi:hypothetical protein
MELWALILTLSLNALAIVLATFRGKRERQPVATALENLAKSVIDLTLAVNNAVEKLANTVPAESVQLASDTINAQTARLVAAVSPPPVP